MCSTAKGECTPEESWGLSVGGARVGSGLMLDRFKGEPGEAGLSSGLGPKPRQFNSWVAQ